jgi:hypothetical protein
MPFTQMFPWQSSSILHVGVAAYDPHPDSPFIAAISNRRGTARAIAEIAAVLIIAGIP